MKKNKVIFKGETFRNIGAYEINNLIQENPSCVNGNLRVYKYKITFEKIEESSLVIADRLQKLWNESDNFHHLEALKQEAKKIGYEFKGSFGKNRKK